MSIAFILKHMIRSMTGYGRSEKKEGNVLCIVEVKSVNHRYIDMSLRLPKSLNGFEDKIKKIIKKKFSRGYFEVFITFENSNRVNKELKLDIELVEQYMKALRDLQYRFKISGDIDINSIIQLKDLLKFEEEKKDTDLYWNILDDTLNDALNALKSMREMEGNALKDDIFNRIAVIKDYTKDIEKRRSSALVEHKERLKNRMADLLDVHDIDQVRLSEEAAILAERSDITEEVTRLKNHLRQFLKINKENNPVGRKLEFIIQELNRETNTIGSKANNYDISSGVIGIKIELEKIREQVQNIE